MIDCSFSFRAERGLINRARFFGLRVSIKFPFPYSFLGEMQIGNFLGWLKVFAVLDPLLSKLSLMVTMERKSGLFYALLF